MAGGRSRRASTLVLVPGCARGGGLSADETKINVFVFINNNQNVVVIVYIISYYVGELWLMMVAYFIFYNRNE